MNEQTDNRQMGGQTPRQTKYRWTDYRWVGRGGDRIQINGWAHSETVGSWVLKS